MTHADQSGLALVLRAGGAMRITVFGLNFFPEQVGIGVYTYDMCQYLASAGHEVEVVAGFPFYPELRRQTGDAGRLFRTDQVGELVVHRCYAYVPSRWGSAPGRIWHELSYAASASVRLASLRRPDVLVVVSPPFAGAVAASVVGRTRRVPVAVHLQDLQTDLAGDLGLLREGPLLRAARRAEQLLLANARLVSTLSEGMRARIIEKGVPERRVVVFPNWVDLDLQPLGSDASRFKAQQGLRDRFLVVYSGSMGAKHGLDLVVRVAAIAEDPGVHFVMIGDGAVRDSLEAEALKLRLTNLTFLPLQPRESFADVIAASDLSIVPQRHEARDLVVPSKLLRLLAGGSPIVAVAHADSGIGRVLRDSGAGEVVSEGDPAAVWAVIKRLKEAPARRADMSRCGRAYAEEHFGRRAVLGRYVEQLTALASHA